LRRGWITPLRRVLRAGVAGVEGTTGGWSTAPHLDLTAVLANAVSFNTPLPTGS